MKMSPGKLWGLRRLADAGGFWKMVAIDQRTPMLAPIAKARGLAEAPYEDVAKVKSILAKHLAPKASAMLIDPNYAYAATIGNIPPSVGVIHSLEHHVVEDTPGGKKSRMIPDWSPAKIRRIGGDAVKVLVWHRHDASPEARAHQLAFVEACGRACKEADLVHLLEILIYPLPGEATPMTPAQRTERAIAAVEDYLDPRFNVDIYKLEPPIPLSNVPDPEGPEAKGVQAIYDRLAKRLNRPWVLLSAGAGPQDFERQLVYGYRSGASGYLCGRAIWANAFSKFPDFSEIDRLVAKDSVPYVERLNALTEKLATPWHKHPGWGGSPSLAIDGPDFAKAYPER
ncbi:MAG: tagatose 1,6-diphosphate aldolase [Alphaproteobacteria bacterium]|nr:tagatose 1,6-diphosphate aldolase [Alphaproteobacteria bacterium]